MAELNLNINDGKEKIYVNKEKYGEDRVIYINLDDNGIFERLKKANEKIKAYCTELSATAETDTRDIIDVFAETDSKIREQINYIFDNEKVSDMVFGSTYCTADVGGKMYIEEFMEAIMPLIEEKFRISAKKTIKKIDKYLIK